MIRFIIIFGMAVLVSMATSDMSPMQFATTWMAFLGLAGLIAARWSR